MTTASSPVLRFHAPTHTYWCGESRLLGATEMLRATGYIDPRWFTDGACERGSYAHQAIAWALAGDLDEDLLDPSLRGYLTAARTFLRASDVEALEVETPRYDATLGIAGTPDVLGTWVAPTGVRRGVLIDWKTGAPQRWHRFQTSIYRHLAQEPDESGVSWPTLDRVCVYLASDGSFLVEPHKDDRFDWQIASAVIAIARDQHAHGGTR